VSRVQSAWTHLLRTFLLTNSSHYWFDLDAIREPVKPETYRRGQTWEERRGHGAPSRHGLTGVVGDSDFAAAPTGKNPGDVWAIPTAGFPAAHFAVMPQEMARRCILAGCPDGGVVLDPFSGSATTGMAAQQLGRRYIGIDLNADYHDLALRTRLRNAALPLPAQEVTAWSLTSPMPRRVVVLGRRHLDDQHFHHQDGPAESKIF